MFTTLTERQQQVLIIIVGQYIREGAPVPSEGVASKLSAAVSPATVRNDMAELEQAGYISRPYTSAGCIPTDLAYRFYVESLGGDLEPAADLQEAMRTRFRRAQPDIDGWSRTAVQILAQMVKYMAVATPPRAVESRWKHLELVYLQEFLVLLVMVLGGTRLKQQLVPLQRPATQDELTLVSNRLNTHFSGLTHQEVASCNVDLSPFEGGVIQAALDILRAEEAEGLGEPSVDGLRHMLRHPDLSGGAHASVIAEFLENRSLLLSVLGEIPARGVVHITIGRENKADLLKPFSVVITQYGIPGEASGVVGIVGPTRMEYPNAISNVRYLSDLMSEMVLEVHGGRN